MMSARATVLVLALFAAAEGGPAPSAGTSEETVAEAVPMRECVILVHGLAARKVTMAKLERALRGDGYDVANWNYLSTAEGIVQASWGLHECYALNAQYHSRVHFVTHSMGGIVVRAMIKRHDLPKLGRIVMIAPPNQGSAVARLLLRGPPGWVAGPAGQELQSKERLDRICAIPTAPTLIIAGTKPLDVKTPASVATQGTLEKPHDGIVSVAETRLPGIPAPLEIEDSHGALPYNPKVIEAAAAFLQADETVDGDERAVFKKGLRLLSADPVQVDALLARMPGLPNIRARTHGGPVWWGDLVVVNGWRVQKNVLFENCRLLDPQNVRRAWGSKADMLKAFAALIEE